VRLAELIVAIGELVLGWLSIKSGGCALPPSGINSNNQLTTNLSNFKKKLFKTLHAIMGATTTTEYVTLLDSCHGLIRDT
jgi:hypothetical protein